MKATVVGFDVTLVGPITVDMLFSNLRSLAGQKLSWRGQDRFVYVAERDGYHVCLMLSVKDHKKSCELEQKTDGTISVSVRESGETKSPIEFNVFAINKATLRGAYLQYRGSCSLLTFVHYLRSQYVKLTQLACKAALAHAALHDSSQDPKAIKARFAKPNLGHSVIVRHGSLQTLLERLKKIESFTFECTTLSQAGGVFTPLQNAVRKEKHSLTFLPTATPRSLREAIASVVEIGQITIGKVKGRNANDIEDFVDLTHNPDVFAFFEFDDIVDEQSFALENIGGARIVDRVMDVIHRERVHFGHE